MTEPFLGEIRAFGFSFAPRGWFPCDGRLLQISQYSAVFSILGVQYGGNGTSNFAIPNLNGRATMSQGQGPGLTPRAVGEEGGVEDVTLLNTEIPAHNHFLHYKVVTGTNTPMTGTPSGSTFLSRTTLSATTPAASFIRPPRTNPASFHPIVVGTAGGSQPHPNLQPYLTMLFCIAVDGVFPSRN